MGQDLGKHEGEHGDRESRNALCSEIEADRMLVPGKSVSWQMVSGTELVLEARLQSLEGSVSQSIDQITCFRITWSAS